MIHLVGHFLDLKKYNDNRELLEYYLTAIDRVYNHKPEDILRFHHYPYDYDISVLGYLIPEGEVLFILLRENTPIMPSNDILSKLLNSSQGFIEIYQLNHDEFKIDMETLSHWFLKWGYEFSKIVIKFNMEKLIDKIRRRITAPNILSFTRRSADTTNAGIYNYLIYSEHLSRQLKDIFYRANILLRKDYRYVETNIDEVFNILHEIMRKNHRVLIIIKVDSYSIWIAQHSSQIGFSVFSDVTDEKYDVRSYNEIQNIISKILSKYIGRIKKVKIFIYALK